MLYFLSKFLFSGCLVFLGEKRRESIFESYLDSQTIKKLCTHTRISNRVWSLFMYLSVLYTHIHTHIILSMNLYLTLSIYLYVYISLSTHLSPCECTASVATLPSAMAQVVLSDAAIGLGEISVLLLLSLVTAAGSNPYRDALAAVKDSSCERGAGQDGAMG